MTEPVVIEFIANANFSQLRAQVAAAQSQMVQFQSIMSNEKLGSGLTNAMRNFQNNLSSLGQYESRMVSLSASTDRFVKSLDTGKMTLAESRRFLDEYRNAATRATSEVAKLGRQQELLSRSKLAVGTGPNGETSAVLGTPKGIAPGDMSKQLVSAQAQLNAVSRLRQIESQQIINMGKNMQWSGRQMMVGLTLPVTLFGAAAAKAFYNVDQELTKMIKVYGDLNTSLDSSQIKELRGQVVGLAKDLASNWGVSSTTTIGIAAQMAAIGKQGNDLIQSTRETSRLSMLGGVDTTASMQTVLSLQSAFKISTDQLAGSIDYLNAVENQTSLSLEDFTKAIPIAGPAVHALGGDIKELSLMLVAMREGGISATQAANALKTSLGRLINPTKAAKDFLKGFNIDLGGIVDKTQGDPVKTIEALQVAMKGLSRLQKDQAMAKIFGLQQYSRMTALFENINKPGGQAATAKQLADASGAQLASVSARELAAAANSASGQFNRAVESAKLAFIGIGETFLKIGTWFLGVFSGIGKIFDNMPSQLQTLIVAGTLIAAAIGPLKMIGGIFLNMWGSIKSMINWFHERATGGRADASRLSAQSVAEQLQAQQQQEKEAMGIFTQSLYDGTKALAVWESSVLSLKEELGLLALNSGGMAGPALTSAAGRTQIADLLRNRDSGHTVLPDVVENKLFGGRLAGPTRTILQDPGLNQAQRAQFGSFYGKSGLASIDPRAFAIGAAQNANFERLAKPMEGFKGEKGLTFNQELDSLVKRVRAGVPEDAAGLKVALTKFYNDYRLFFEDLEVATKQDAIWLEQKIAEYGKLSHGEARGRLMAALDKLGVSEAKFEAAMAGQAYDVRSLAAQMDAHLALGGATRAGQSNGSYAERPYGRVGQVMGAMAGNGLPVSFATLDNAGAAFAASVTEAAAVEKAAATEAATVTKTASVEDSKLRLSTAEAERANALEILAVRKQELAAATESVLMASTWTEKFLTRGVELEAKRGVASAKAARDAAEIQLKGAQEFDAIVVAAAEKVAAIEASNARLRGTSMPSTAVSQAASGGIKDKLSGMLSGKAGMGAMGGAMMGGLVLSMIPDTGNASVDNTKNIAGSALSLGTMGAMVAGPWGAALGAIAGAAKDGLPLLITKLNETQDALNAAFTTGETATKEFGAQLKSITDVQMTDMINKMDVVTSSYKKFLDGFNGAQAGSEDRKFIDSLMGASPEEIANQIKRRIAAGFAAGMKPEDLKAEVAAALAASGNSGQLGLMDLIIGKNGKLDTSKLMQDQISDVQKAVAKAAADMPPIIPVSHPMSDGAPGSAEWNKTEQAQLDQIANYKHMIATSEDVQKALKPLADNFMSIAVSMNAANFDKFIKSEQLAGISADSFNEYIKQIPGVSEDVKNAVDALTTHGATTTQILEAINLKSQGVIQTWGELAGLPPAQLDIMFSINKEKVDITNLEVAPLLKSARAALAKIGSADIWDAKKIQAASKKRQDAWNKEKKALDDKAKKEIDAIKKVEDARQKAADAEAKRLQREKEMADLAIGYREAIAGGDMAKAAQIQNTMQNNKAQWALDDKNAAAKDKAQAKIDAINNEKDARIAAIDALMAKDAAATQNMVDNVDKHNAAVKKQNADELAAAQSKVDQLIALSKKPWSPEVQAEINKLATSMGVKNGNALKDALTTTLGPVGTEIWKKVSGDLTDAPWDLIGQLVDAKINGTGADVTRILGLIDKWNPTGPSTGTTGKGKFAGKPLPLGAATGGQVWGAGTGTSDSINARLSHGEFVVRASSVNKYGAGLLHAINSGNFANGGLVGNAAAAYAKEGLLSGVSKLVQGLFNPGTDAGRPGGAGGGSAKVVGSGPGAAMAQWAEQFVGVPYSRTSADPKHGWGCATFVDFLYKHFGVRLPSATLSNDQYNGLKTSVNPKQITAGDLLFYHYANGVNVKNRVNHVGLALNGNAQIEAANPKAGTRISGIDWGNFVGAKRVFGPDGVPMLAQGGEFMMNRAAVQMYGGGMMNAINNRTYHTGGMVTKNGPKLDKFASGGGATYDIKVYAAPGMDVDDLANAVMAKMQTFENRKGRNR